MKFAIYIDAWNLPIFERHLKQAGLAHEQRPGITPDTLLLKVEVDDPREVVIVPEVASRFVKAYVEVMDTHAQAERVHMAQILKRLYLARKARREAREAFGKYLNDAWGDGIPDENGRPTTTDRSHKFSCCGLGYTGGSVYYGDTGVPILCPVCAGSAPYHDTYVKASRRAGSALRVAQAWGKRFAEGERA